MKIGPSWFLSCTQRLRQCTHIILELCPYLKTPFAWDLVCNWYDYVNWTLQQAARVSQNSDHWSSQKCLYWHKSHISVSGTFNSFTLIFNFPGMQFPKCVLSSSLYCVSQLTLTFQNANNVIGLPFYKYCPRRFLGCQPVQLQPTQTGDKRTRQT